MSAPWSAQLGSGPALLGMPVIETPKLKYDQCFVSRTSNAVMVGEVAHFRWRIEQLNRNKACRATAQAHIEAMATRILGEPWKVSA